MKIIGMVHLKALPGYGQHTSMVDVIEYAVESAKILEQGGVNEILIENTGDDPHQKYVTPEIISAFTYVALEIKSTEIDAKIQIFTRIFSSNTSNTHTLCNFQKPQ